MFRGIPLNTLLIYNSALLIFYIWFLIKYRKNSTSMLIITLFFAGLFSDSRILLNSNFVFNIYKIVIFVWTIKLFSKHITNRYMLVYKNIMLTFAMFSLYFFIFSLFIHHDRIMLIISQWNKYSIPLMFIIILGNEMRDIRKVELFNKLFGTLILVQIILSILKLLLVQNYYEGLVGSITGYAGGGPGTSLPLLGLVWLMLNNKMNFKWRNLLYFVGLLFIGLVTGKRAVLLLFPILFGMLYMLSTENKNIFKSLRIIFSILIIIPVITYLGFRLNPTLNPDNRIWGRFDIDYAWSYALQYSTGSTSNSEGIQKGSGRVGAVNLIWDEIVNSGNNKSIFLLGNGLEYLAEDSFENYTNSNYFFGIDHRGSITGIIQFVLSIGLFGGVLFIVYLIVVISNLVNYKRLRYLLILLVLFDYIFYNSTIVQVPALTIILIFVMLLSQVKYDNRCNYIK